MMMEAHINPDCKDELHPFSKMSGTFPKTISQAATSQGYKSVLAAAIGPQSVLAAVLGPQSVLVAAIGPQSVLAAALGPLAQTSLGSRPPLQPTAPFRGPNLTFGKLKIDTWKVALGKMPLAKYITQFSRLDQLSIVATPISYYFISKKDLAKFSCVRS